MMAGGVNYNGIWAGLLGQPICLYVHKAPFRRRFRLRRYRPGPVGSKVKRRKVGDEVVHRNQDDMTMRSAMAAIRCLGQPAHLGLRDAGRLLRPVLVQSRQLMLKPRHSAWEEVARYTLTLATAHRMLFGHAPHTIKPGDNVSVWGARGLGSPVSASVPPSGANAIGDLWMRPSATMCLARRQGRYQPQGLLIAK